VKRPTSDVDIIVREDDRGILRFLRDRGLAPVHFSEQHFSIFIDGTQKGDRIDILFPRVEPLASAWRTSVTKRLDGVALPVVETLPLCLHKLMSERPLEQRDALALIDAGLVTSAAVKTGLRRLARRESEPHDRWQRRLFDPYRGLAALSAQTSAQPA
jgi:hypothetical protein